MLERKMKTKLIIFDKTHTVRRVISSKKNTKGTDLVTSKGEDYKIGGDNFVITSEGRFWKKHYVTYYYRQKTPEPLPVPLFPDIKHIGIQSDDLNKILTPHFYRILAPEEKNKKQDWILYASVGSLLVGIFCAWKIMGLPDAIAKAIGSAVGVA